MIHRTRENWSRDVDAVIRSRHYTWLGMGLGGEPIQDALVPVLTDLMHICKRSGIAWEPLVEKSRTQFEQEECDLAEQ